MAVLHYRCHTATLGYNNAEVRTPDTYIFVIRLRHYANSQLR